MYYARGTDIQTGLNCILVYVVIPDMSQSNSKLYVDTYTRLLYPAQTQ